MLPVVDFVFKLLFGDIKHKERLISLLCAILNLPGEVDPALNWMRFLAARTKGEMEMHAKNDDEIKEAYDYLQVISKDREKRMVYEARQAWLMDQRTREKIAREEGIQKGIQEGIQEGMQKGIEKEKLNTAKNLLSLGMSIVDIAKVTGLKVEEIEKLK